MRALVLACLVSPLCLASLAGCIDNDQVRVQSLAAGAGGNFTFSAHTNTVMTANADGAAERIRRDWLAQSLEVRAMCRAGYVVDERRLVVPPQRPAFAGSAPGAAAAEAGVAFGNGGDVVYSGRCL